MGEGRWREAVRDRGPGMVLVEREGVRGLKNARV